MWDIACIACIFIICMYLYVHVFVFTCMSVILTTYHMRKMQMFQSNVYDNTTVLCLIRNQHSTAEKASQTYTNIRHFNTRFVKIKLYSRTTAWLHRILTISGNLICRFSLSRTVLDRPLHQINWNKMAAFSCSGPEVIMCDRQQKDRSQPGVLLPVTLTFHQTPLEA